MINQYLLVLLPTSTVRVALASVLLLVIKVLVVLTNWQVYKPASDEFVFSIIKSPLARSRIRDELFKTLPLKYQVTLLGDNPLFKQVNNVTQPSNTLKSSGTIVMFGFPIKHITTNVILITYLIQSM